MRLGRSGHLNGLGRLPDPLPSMGRYRAILVRWRSHRLHRPFGGTHPGLPWLRVLAGREGHVQDALAQATNDCVSAYLHVISQFTDDAVERVSSLRELSILPSLPLPAFADVKRNVFGLFMLEVYYISVAFQAIYNTSATGAGIRLLPFIMVQIVILIASSRVIPLIGRYKYVITAGPVFLAIGSGLLYTVKYGTPISHLMGFQAFLGVGIGLCLQNTMVAVQHELKAEPWLVSAGTGLSVFSKSKDWQLHGRADRQLGLEAESWVYPSLDPSSPTCSRRIFTDTLPPFLGNTSKPWSVEPMLYGRLFLMPIDRKFCWRTRRRSD